MFKRTILTILAAFILTSFIPGCSKKPAAKKAAETKVPEKKGDAVLTIVPADAILCLRINNLNQTTANLDQFLIGVSPMPVSTGGLIKGQLGMMFGNPDLKGFDVNASFAAFAMADSPDTTPDIYILLPVTNYALITDPNFRVSPPDTNGISAVGMGPSSQFFIKKIDSFAMMSHDYQKLGSMAATIANAKSPLLASSLDAAQAKQSSTEPVWAYANLVKISSLYKTDISNGIEEMRKRIADPAMTIQNQIDNLEKIKTQMAARDPNSPTIARLDSQLETLKKRKEQAMKSPVFMKGLANAFAGLANGFVQQSKSFTLSCNPKPVSLNLNIGLDALPGSEMANMLVSEPPAGPNPLLGYTEDGAAMNMEARIDHPAFKKLNDKAIDLLATMTGKDVNDPNFVKIKMLVGQSADSIGNFVVCSFTIDPNTKPMFDAKYVLEVKDANRFNTVIDMMAQLWAGSAFNDLYKSFGMETSFIVKRGVENYKGVSIDTANLSMKFNDTNAPEAQMLEKMYGSGFEYHWANVNGLWVCRIAGDPNAIYKLIDQVKAGTPAQPCPEFQKAMALIPDAGSKDVILTYNYLRLMKMFNAFGQMPFAMPDVASKSNLVFACKVGNGSLSIDFVLPKEHLSEIMTAVMMIQQQQMQQNTRAKPGRPVNAPPPAK